MLLPDVGVYELSVAWRTHAGKIAAYAPLQAAVFEKCAERLECALEEWNEQPPLTLQEAATESGYSERHLRRLIRQGKLLDVDGSGRPRIPREALAAAAEYGGCQRGSLTSG